jgi:hypothetical protein
MLSIAQVCDAAVTIERPRRAARHVGAVVAGALFVFHKW